MVNLQGVVNIIIYLLIAGAVFGLLYWLVTRIGKEFPGETSQLFVKVARIVLIVLAVLVLIGILISVIGGQPVFRWG